MPPARQQVPPPAAQSGRVLEQRVDALERTLALQQRALDALMRAMELQDAAAAAAAAAAGPGLGAAAPSRRALFGADPLALSRAPHCNKKYGQEDEDDSGGTVGTQRSSDGSQYDYAPAHLPAAHRSRPDFYRYRLDERERDGRDGREEHEHEHEQRSTAPLLLVRRASVLDQQGGRRHGPGRARAQPPSPSRHAPQHLPGLRAAV